MNIYDSVERLMHIRNTVKVKLREYNANEAATDEQVVATYVLAAVVQDVEWTIDLMREDEG